MVRSSRVWFITGAGRGIGRALTEAALAAGDAVVGTVRRHDALAGLDDQYGDALQVEVLDVRDRDAVDGAVRRGVERHGCLDVVVNNAGYGVVGTIEELDEQEVRDAARHQPARGDVGLPGRAPPPARSPLRAHRADLDVGGVGTMPAFGAYNASKWALEAFSEAMAAEVRPFGVRVTIAELGGFATDWGGSSMRFAEPLAAYDQLRTDVFGTPDVPWAAATRRRPSDRRPAGRGRPSDPGARRGRRRTARLLVGDDAPTFVAMALAARSTTTGARPASSGRHRARPTTVLIPGWPLQ